MSGAIHVGLLNVRSLRNKVDHIGELLSEFNLDMLCLTETWLHETDTDIIEAALPKTHTLLHVPRSRGALWSRGGGIGLIYSRALTGTRILPLDFDVSSFEVMEVVTRRARSVLRVAIVYRPGHSGTDVTFIEEFGSYVETLSTKEGKLLICGDFNYWMDDPGGKPYSYEFIRLLDVNNLVNNVLHPTHISSHVLDLVLTPTDSDDVSGLEVVPMDMTISDHSLVRFRLYFPKIETYIKTISFRRYSMPDEGHYLGRINDALNNIDSSNLSAEQLVDIHNDFFSSFFSEHCPVVTKDISVRDDSPWYDASVVYLRRCRRKAERKWRRTRTASARRRYIAARSAVVSCVVRRKRVYYRNQVISCAGDREKLAGVIRSLMQRRQAPVLPGLHLGPELAASFADFFSEKVARIREDLDDGMGLQNFSVDIGRSPSPAVVFSGFEHVDIRRVKALISEVKKTFCSLDPINVQKLKPVYECAAPFIKKVIDKSFDEGTFPSSQKRSIIHPLLKKKGLDKENMANYRPVSNLTFLSKILERAILDQMDEIFRANNIIPVHQSAYRRHHSTETALCRIYNDLVVRTCEGQHSLLLVLDLSAAFDTVDHGILLEDLSQCGIRGRALGLLRSYLGDRYQQVVVEGTNSEPFRLQYGVPQGSVLGPVLFLVYTRSLARLLAAHGVEFHFYADDTQIYIRIVNVGETKTRVGSLMSDIKIWMRERKLKLNEGKTEIILVSGNLRSNVADDFGNIDVGSSILTPVDAVKNLGIVFDSELSFKKQVDAVVKSCNLQIRNIYAIRKYLDIKCLNTLVYSLILSRIDYCCSLYAGLPNYLLRKLQSIMNRAARLIYFLPPRTPTTRYLIELHWLPIKARIEFKICLLAFKALRFGEPRYLSDLLVRQGGGFVALRSSDDPFRLVEPRAPSERHFAERSFSYIAPRLLNRLPASLKQLESLDVFKSRLKSFLFTRAYDLDNQRLCESYRV